MEPSSLASFQQQKNTDKIAFNTTHTFIMAASKDKLTEAGDSTTNTTTDPIALAEEGNEHLTGFKLAITVFSLTCVGFLMLLDVSVVSTVSSRCVSRLDAYR